MPSVNFIILWEDINITKSSTTVFQPSCQRAAYEGPLGILQDQTPHGVRVGIPNLGISKSQYMNPNHFQTTKNSTNSKTWNGSTISLISNSSNLEQNF
jgi:hypothetical protein